MTGTALGPVAPQERLLALDLLRGFALFGILVVNMQFFAEPLGVAIGADLVDAPPSERAAWNVVKALFESKFIGMFSMLFGAGLVLQSQRAAARGQAIVGTYLRRLVLLAVFGLGHALLLWYGDILFIYAFIALGVFWFRNASGRTLLKIAGGVFAVAFVLQMSCLGVQVLSASLAGARPEVDAGLRGIAAMTASQWDPTHPAYIRAEMMAYSEGPYGELFAVRAVTFIQMLVYAAAGFGWWAVTMFFAGMGLMRSGFFGPDAGPWPRRVAIVGFAVGIPLEIVAAVLFRAGGYDVLGHHGALGVVGAVVHILAVPALTFGYIGTLTLLVQRGIAQRVCAFIGRAGRMALTVYISESVVVTSLMYFYGAGWFGTVSRWEQIGLAVAIWAALVVLANVWMSRFAMGPLEWLWRVGTYARLVPLRRFR